MRKKTFIRKSQQGDSISIELLYRDAFPEENLLPLVKDLLREPSVVLSLAGFSDTSLVGHVVFTTCGIAGSADRVGLLGPLAVATACQRQGIGSALIRDGLLRLETARVSQVCVLGDPAYYGRFGFTPKADITPPYPLPAKWREAWQTIRLRPAAPPGRGRLTVPPPWRQPALWAP